MNITVQYPTSERVITKTLAEAKALGYKSEISKTVYMNRPSIITVKRLSRRVQEEFMTAQDYEAEMTVLCVSQTGMTPSDYQAKFKRSWNV
jgi:hypothetical protein